VSTKIYYAWKVDLPRLREFQVELEGYVIDTAAKKFAKAKDGIRSCGIQERLIVSGGEIGEVDNRDDYLAVLSLVVAGVVSSQSPFKSNLALDFCYNVWVNETHAFVIPYSGFNDEIFDFEFDGCESYGYWNNTDQPDGITDSEWEARREQWNQFINNHDRGRMVCEIISFDTKGQATGIDRLLKANGYDDKFCLQVAFKYKKCQLPRAVLCQLMMIPANFKSPFIAE